MIRRMAVLVALPLAILAIAGDTHAQSRYRRSYPAQGRDYVHEWQVGMQGFFAETFRLGDIEACRIHQGTGDETEYNCIHYGTPSAPAYAQRYYDYSRNYGPDYGPYYMGQRYPWGDSRYSWNRNYAPGPGYDTPDRGHHQATQNNVNVDIAIGAANLGYNVIHDTIQDRRTNRRLDEISRKLDRSRPEGSRILDEHGSSGPNAGMDEIDRRYGLAERPADRPPQPRRITVVNLTGCDARVDGIILPDKGTLELQGRGQAQVASATCNPYYEQLGADVVALKCR